MLWFLRAFVPRLPFSASDLHMLAKWSDEQQNPLLLNLTDTQKADDTLWTDVKLAGPDVPMEDASGTPGGGKPRHVGHLEVSAGVVAIVNSLWGRIYTAVHKCKERYENESSQSKQASSVAELTEGLMAAGACLKKIMSKRFKMVEGIKYFEVYWGEWV